MSWGQTHLGNLISISKGKKHTPILNGAHRYINIEDLHRDKNPQYTNDKGVWCNPNDLIIAWDGANAGKVGVGYEGVIGSTLARLFIKNPEIDARFLFWFLESKNETIKSQRTGATIPHISGSSLKDILIPIPPLPIQKRIAEILDAADALKRKDQQLLKKYDELAQAIFIDMFGDPVKNEKEWQRVTFKEILEKIESGWSPVCYDKSASNDEWGVLKLGAITKCVYNENENKALLKCDKPRENIEVKNGDLLFSRKNTYELVAACALVKKTRPHLMLSDLIFRFKLKQDSIVSPVYLHGLLTHSSKRSNIQSLAGGAAGSMPNISKEKLMGIKIELPPFALQNNYSLIIESINNSLENAKESLLKTNQLFDSLIQKAFTGELVS